MDKLLNIDLVYLWVDSRDIKWQEEKLEWAKKLGYECEISLNSCRYTDNEELRYSLRSAQMYAPWLHKIYIITNGQIPKWLDCKNSKIEIIKHSDIMPENCYPTFNSEAIETCIANIPQLSEYFLLSCDDKFFASKVSPEDFFDENNNPIVKLRPQNWCSNEINNSLYMQSYMYTVSTYQNKIKSKYNYKNMEPFHCIEAYRKSYFLECAQIFHDEFSKTRQKRFRSKNSIQHPIVDFYMIDKKKCKLSENVPVQQQKSSKHVENLYLTLGKKDNMLNMINDKSPKLLCINDSELVQDVYRKTLKYMLEELYPTKQSWEVNSAEYSDQKDSAMETYFSYALDNNFFNKFLYEFGILLEHLEQNANYTFSIINTNITEENKNLIRNKLPKNINISFINLDSLVNKSPYIEEINLTKILSQTQAEEKLVFWGASLFLEDFINKYNINMKNICGIVDVDTTRTGEFIGKYKICTPENINQLKPDKVIVTIINSTETRMIEIKKILYNNGYGDVSIERL